METVSDRALALLAQVAQQCPTTHLIMGDKELVADFWSHYESAGRHQRLGLSRMLFEMSWPVAPLGAVSALRPARANELELVMPVQLSLRLLKAA